MSERESAQEIEEIAARWAVRADAGPLDAEARAELDAWLAGDMRRRGAYLRARAGLRYIDQASAAQQVEADGRSAAPALGEWTEAAEGRRRRRLPILLGGGAAIAAIAAAATFYLSMPLQLTTGVGEVRRIALEDGSVATLNTDSDIDVAMARDSRHITLDRGEAWFQVAHDTARPFVVSAGDTHVRATGTAFSVRRLDGGADVVVSEGTVLAWVEGRAPVALHAGQQIALRTAAVERPVVAPVKPNDALAWRSGGISLEGQTISAAAAEFNRYNAVKIEVADPAIGSQKVVGYFEARQPDQFAAAAAQMSGARLRKTGNRIVLTRQ